MITPCWCFFKFLTGRQEGVATIGAVKASQERNPEGEKEEDAICMCIIILAQDTEMLCFFVVDVLFLLLRVVENMFDVSCFLFDVLL